MAVSGSASRWQGVSRVIIAGIGALSRSLM
jgi:hypothetical protein